MAAYQLAMHKWNTATDGSAMTGRLLRQRRGLALAAVVGLHLLALLALLEHRASEGLLDGTAGNANALRFQLVSTEQQHVTDELRAPVSTAPIELVMPEQPPAELAPMWDEALAAAAAGDCRAIGAAIARIALPVPDGIAGIPSGEVEITTQIDAEGRALPEGILITRSSMVAALDEAALHYALAQPLTLRSCEGNTSREVVTVRFTFGQ